MRHFVSYDGMRVLCYFGRLPAEQSCKPRRHTYMGFAATTEVKDTSN